MRKEWAHVPATLHPGRIRLVPLSDAHLEQEVDLDSDPEVMRYLGNGRARTGEEVERLHRRRLAAARRVPGLGFWVGFVDDEFVGWWILEPPDRADQGPVEGQAERTGSCAATGATAWPAKERVSSSGTGLRTWD